MERLLAEAEGDDVAARLDAVYAEEPSDLDPALRDAQVQALVEPWWSTAAISARAALAIWRHTTSGCLQERAADRP